MKPPNMILTMVVTAIATMLWAGVPGTELWVSSLARIPGANGSQWYATVWIHNPGAQAAQVHIAYLARNRANPSPPVQTVQVDPGETLKLADVFQDVFGMETATGALRFSSNRKVVVSARSYNLTAADVADSLGEFLAGIPAERDKPERLRGRYLEPEAYGQPETAGIGFENAERFPKRAAAGPSDTTGSNPSRRR